jgi:LPXTG-motif cell wall-anchored protein
VAALVGMLAFAFFVSPAGAALQSFGATGTGYGLKVTIDLSGLPQSVKDAVNTAWTTAYAALPQNVKDVGVPATFPYKIEETFLKSTSDATPTVTKAVAVLADGTVPAQKDWIVSADTNGQNTRTTVSSADFLKYVDAGGLNIHPVAATGGLLEAVVSAGPKVDGNATLANVTASLKDIAALLPAEFKTAFQGVIDQAEDAINDATSTFNTTVDAAADAADSALAGTPLGSALTGAGVDVSDLAAAIDLPSNLQLPDDVLGATTLASVSELVNKATAVKAGDLASADATSSVKSVGLLDGFVSSGILNLASHSEAGGAKGTAKNTSSCSIADLRVGNEFGVSFDGTNLYVKGIAVPVPADQVANVATQARNLLASVGVTVTPCNTAEHNEAADGTAAAQKVSALTIDVNPKVPSDVTTLDPAVQTALTNVGLAAGQPLGVHVIIDPTVQTAVQAAQSAPAQLPRTGAPAVATALAGMALTGGGLFLRRRVR